MNLTLIEDPSQGTVQGTVIFGDGGTLDLGTRQAQGYANALTASSKARVGLLPPAVRWLSGDRRVVVFERPPGLQKVSYYPVERDQIANLKAHVKAGNTGTVLKTKFQLYEFIIPVPWLVYVVGFGLDCLPVTVRVYMRKEPLNSLSDSLYLFPMLNFYSNSKLCQPIFEKYEAKTPSISEGLQSAYNTVWNSGFNYDLKDATKIGQTNYSPVKPTAAYYGEHVANFFASWADLSVHQMLTAKYVNPAVKPDIHEPSPHPLSVQQAVNHVTQELFHEHMGSKNLTKNFITTLVNNFNLCQ